MKIIRTNPENGQSIILFALVLIGILAVAALAIDGGRIFVDRRNAQSAADAAAMSGAVAKCKGEDITTAARAMALANGYDNAGTTTNTVEVFNPPDSGLYSSDSNYVKVKITTNIQTSIAQVAFGGLLKQEVSAIAVCAPGAGPADGYGLMVLNKTDTGILNGTGSGYIWVDNGGIWVNSSNDPAVTASREIWADAINIVGDYDHHDEVCVGDYGDAGCPSPTVGVTQIDDPFTSLVPPPDPDPTGDCLDGKTTGNRTYDPGKYCTIDISGSGTIVFNPGIYWIENPSSKINGFQNTGSGTFTANGVLFYIKDGAFDMSGSGTLSISGMTSGVYKGMALYMDQANSGDINLTGSGTITSMEGTFYAPASEARVTGTTDTIINAQIICNTYTATGGSILHIEYDSSVVYDGGSSLSISLVE